MSPTNTSIFDLSPSEKLQLVEDLWDDLATTPEAVPVHDWQKEELARRKARLMETRLPDSRGKKSNEESEVAMAAELIIAPKAEQDVAEAHAWSKVSEPVWGRIF